MGRLFEGEFILQGIYNLIESVAICEHCDATGYDDADFGEEGCHKCNGHGLIIIGDYIVKPKEEPK